MDKEYDVMDAIANADVGIWYMSEFIDIRTEVLRKARQHEDVYDDIRVDGEVAAKKHAKALDCEVLEDRKIVDLRESEEKNDKIKRIMKDMGVVVDAEVTVKLPSLNGCVVDVFMKRRNCDGFKLRSVKVGHDTEFQVVNRASKHNGEPWSLAFTPCGIAEGTWGAALMCRESANGESDVYVSYFNGAEYIIDRLEKYTEIPVELLVNGNIK